MVSPKIPAPEPVAYLYTDARTPEGTHPWLRETMLVLACDRRHGRLRADGRREAALITLASAETYAAALAEKARQEERERLRGYFREALADTGITWPAEVDILYDRCFSDDGRAG
jgi:hypothetical protein